MMSKNVPTTFLVEESDFLLVSGRFRLNFNADSMFSLMEDLTSLSDFCTLSTKRLLKQIFISKIQNDQ